MRLLPASSKAVTVVYSTVDGSATAGTDYVVTSGTLTFAPGDVSETAMVQVSGDVIDELNEQYTVQLSNPTNATIENAIGTGTIADDHGDRPHPSMTSRWSRATPERSMRCLPWRSRWPVAEG